MAAQSVRRREFGRRAEPHRITISRGEKVQSFTIRPWIAATIGTVALAVTAAYFAATGYLIYRDDIIGGALARQARLQHAYEDRSAALRTQIDRINARQLIDQESFEAKIAELMKRQDVIIANGGAVIGLAERARDLGVDPVSTGSFPRVKEKQSGVFGTGSNSAAVKNGAASAFRAATAAKNPGARIGEVSSELDVLQSRQLAWLDGVVRDVEQRSSNIMKAANRLGLPLEAAQGTTAALPARNSANVGGPLVALPPGVFRDRLMSTESALARFERVMTGLLKLPIRKPTDSESPVTSDYGPRRDPFLGVMAMHTGIDFRAETGDPIRATGAGRVIKSGREGGYGLMVEIDHDNGLTTRFGHMSRILVQEGDWVRVGDIVGLVGSTGRSTGPHLHYETRVRGDAVDPMNYIAAGKAIEAYLR